MEEQTTQQAQEIQQSTQSDANTAPEWDATADGAVYSTEPEEETQPELADDGAAITDDGELEFGKNFFGDIGQEPEEPEQPEQQQTAPKWYTDEELKTIPFEQWEEGRLNGEVGKFFPIVKQQIQARQQQAQIQAQAQAFRSAPLPQDIAEPKQYEAKELTAEARKLACEKLGITDDDYDFYEPEHIAATNLAMSELLSKRTDEIRAYQQTKAEWDDNQAFQAALTRQPDFAQFNAWYMRKVQEAGATPQQVNAGLMNLARQNGNRFGLIKQIVSDWYQDFRQETAQQQIQRVKPQAQPQRRKPPVLEGTKGTNYTGGYELNLDEFGSMTPDEQAEALIKLKVI